MRVHKDGCADVSREMSRANGGFRCEADSAEGVIKEAWQDFIEETDGDLSDFWANTEFAPCVDFKETVSDVSLLNVVRLNRKTNTTGPVLEFLGAESTRVWLRQADSLPFPVRMAAFEEHYVAYPIPEVPAVVELPEVPAVVESPEVTGNYAVVYARGMAHLQGLSEVVRDRGTEDAPEWTYSACPALSKNRTQWVTAWQGTDLATAMKELESCGKYRATGVCKKCARTGSAQLESSTASDTVEARVEEAKPNEFDWSAYDVCPKCLVEAGHVCKGVVPRRGEKGLGHNGQRPLRRPHKERPKLNAGPAALKKLLKLS